MALSRFPRLMTRYNLISCHRSICSTSTLFGKRLDSKAQLKLKSPRKQSTAEEVDKQYFQQLKTSRQWDPESANPLESEAVASVRKQKIAKYKTIERRYFKQPQEPNILTWQAKEMIRYLHRLDAEKWTVEELADHFHISKDGGSKLLAAKWIPESVQKHDTRMFSNLKRLGVSQGKIDALHAQYPQLKKEETGVPRLGSTKPGFLESTVFALCWQNEKSPKLLEKRESSVGSERRDKSSRLLGEREVQQQHSSSPTSQKAKGPERSKSTGKLSTNGEEIISSATSSQSIEVRDQRRLGTDRLAPVREESESGRLFSGRGRRVSVRRRGRKLVTGNTVSSEDINYQHDGLGFSFRPQDSEKSPIADDQHTPGFQGTYKM